MSLVRLSTENVNLSSQNPNVSFSTPSNEAEVMEHSLCIEYENSSSDDTILG